MEETQTIGTLLAGRYGEKTILRRPSELSRNKIVKKIIIYPPKPLVNHRKQALIHAHEYQWGSFPSDAAYDRVTKLRVFALSLHSPHLSFLFPETLCASTAECQLFC